MYDEATNDATTARSGTQAAGGTGAIPVSVSEAARLVTDASRKFVTLAVLKKFPGDFDQASDAVTWAYITLLKSDRPLEFDERGPESAFCALWRNASLKKASTLYQQDMRRRLLEKGGATAVGELMDLESDPHSARGLTEAMKAEMWRILRLESSEVSLEVLGKHHPADHPKTDEEVREILFGPSTNPESIRKQIDVLKQRRSRFIRTVLAPALKWYLEQ